MTRKIIFIGLGVLVLGVGGFVGRNFWNDRNVTKIEQTDIPSFEDIARLRDAETVEPPQAEAAKVEEAAPSTQQPTQSPTTPAEPAPTEPTPAEAEPAPDNPSSFAVGRTGQFSGDNGYSVSGQASIKEVDGQTLLVFEESFQSSGGPDLVVYLSPNDVQAGEPLGDFISLNALKENSGGQVYAVPENIDDFNSVVIWCRAFSAQFGAADLE